MTVALWVRGARPRTLVAAVVPVAVGTAAVVGLDGPITNAMASSTASTVTGIAPTPWWRAGLALLVAVSLQVGVNYANDYSDGIRGTDHRRVRIGPVRLVGSGLVQPARVRFAAVVAFGVAGVAGFVLSANAGWWLILVGIVCVAAAWGYTGGPRPYGYAGLGEVFVFVFFGLVATVGTAYVLVERFDLLFVVVSVPVGLWAVALLVANNLRDISGDAASGKHTLAVRLGDRATRVLYVVVLVLSYAVAILGSLSGRATWAALLGLPLAVAAVVMLRRASTPEALVGVLAATGRLQLVSGLGLAAGLALGG